MKHEKEAIQYKLQHQEKFLLLFQIIFPCKIRMSNSSLHVGRYSFF